MVRRPSVVGSSVTEAAVVDAAVVVGFVVTSTAGAALVASVAADSDLPLVVTDAAFRVGSAGLLVVTVGLFFVLVTGPSVVGSTFTDSKTPDTAAFFSAVGAVSITGLTFCPGFTVKRPTLLAPDA